MSSRQRRPGDPYEVGYARPPKQTRFKKGISGNPHGRPRKKPDLYTELRRVLNETVTVTIEGEPQRVTVQQALLLRLRDESLRGEIWASKLVQKVIDAFPEGADEYDHIERQVFIYRAKTFLSLKVEDTQRDKANQTPEPTEDDNGG
jgi:hypothetical protein